MNGHLTLDEMQNYVGLAEREIATQKAQNVVLREELERSQRLIESLQYKLHESEATNLARTTEGTSFAFRNGKNGVRRDSPGHYETGIFNN
jgi:hypothetical protein